MSAISQSQELTARPTMRINGVNTLLEHVDRGFPDAAPGIMLKEMVKRWRAIGVQNAEAILKQRVDERYRQVVGLCDSPIEQVVLYGLLTAPWENDQAFVPDVVSCKTVEAFPPGDVIIFPQYPIIRFRVDFMVLVKHGSRSAMFAVECDGREYHTLSADKDRERDTLLNGMGISVFRIEGATAHFNPMAAVRLIAAAVQEWRG